MEICKAKADNPKNVELASRYNAGKSTISEILKKKEHYLSIQPNDYRRERPSKRKAIEGDLDSETAAKSVITSAEAVKLIDKPTNFLTSEERNVQVCENFLGELKMSKGHCVSRL
ncbi:8229_t:CDS:2 [Paraglomus brasilianum]|uniref:8229_t:CDS:1 n=1 Tax=Paraglomus brasilianum TaxID=144538 RepID=A0A9N9G0E2_9GLOM|nr:8229_t:CDS:2 [Paraglomus brasilianum]